MINIIIGQIFFVIFIIAGIIIKAEIDTLDSFVITRPKSHQIPIPDTESTIKGGDCGLSSLTPGFKPS